MTERAVPAERAAKSERTASTDIIRAYIPSRRTLSAPVGQCDCCRWSDTARYRVSMTPLEIAQAIIASSEVTRDPTTGLYILDGTVPPTELTLADYERGMRIVTMREAAKQE